MKTSKALKWVSGGLELLLGIPLIGAYIVMSMWYIPLLVMLGLHITTLVFSNKEGMGKGGSIVGIVTSCIAIIPFIGMAMHLITGILLIVDAATNKQSDKPINVTIKYEE
ncbi:hypothetical protein [Alkalihalobacillus sp. AL-G]|uniref:hypothetical protein n=1 Tax=Alkalihalobacillus sp. AL-G TaxID=2926399 RepID=UPI0027296D5A|nr:hypothetical protein [Alkalihalobacillus sp. AL-G]WLD92707.1 hypothetical protein MOJ78_17095 [Alkalihalobacillus sp. AL-G]